MPDTITLPRAAIKSSTAFEKLVPNAPARAESASASRRITLWPVARRSVVEDVIVIAPAKKVHLGPRWQEGKATQGKIKATFPL